MARCDRSCSQQRIKAIEQANKGVDAFTTACTTRPRRI
jgi:hypothetical protein